MELCLLKNAFEIDIVTNHDLVVIFILVKYLLKQIYKLIRFIKNFSYGFNTIKYICVNELLKLYIQELKFNQNKNKIQYMIE
jgi:hypothetical protein